MENHNVVSIRPTARYQSWYEIGKTLAAGWRTRFQYSQFPQSADTSPFRTMVTGLAHQLPAHMIDHMIEVLWLEREAKKQRENVS